MFATVLYLLCSLIQLSTSCSLVDCSHASLAALLPSQLSKVYSTTLQQLVPNNLLGTWLLGKTLSCESLFNQLILVSEYKLQRC